MAGIWFNPETLADSLNETVGYKAGLALSAEEICDQLAGTGYPDVIKRSEIRTVRLRSEEYEELFYKLLHRVGYTTEEHGGAVASMASLYHKYKKADLATYEGVMRLYHSHARIMMEEAMRQGVKSMDPTDFMRNVFAKYGERGLRISMEVIETFNRVVSLSPHSIVRYTEWRNIEKLSSLFAGGKTKPAYGEFIDQRFIDYLSQNPESIGKMHWRKFEELTAEYFFRVGYKVELGPGGNDDGVDIRIWLPDESENAPHGIIQCKRQKDKVEKVVVKGLMTDVQFADAHFGLIVTSSELSVGARNTIVSRGYPIEEVNKEGVAKWLMTLRTPGTGIVRN
ncbi:MAG: restriction endonuclease [Pseudomonadales bacterium]